MVVVLPNTGIQIPDQGNRSWYDEFVALMQALDTAVNPDTYIVPASAYHLQASMAALFNDIYARAYRLETTTATDVVTGADTITVGGVQVIARL